MTAYQSDRIEDLYSETFSVLYVKKDADFKRKTVS